MITSVRKVTEDFAYISQADYEFINQHQTMILGFIC